MKRKNIIVLVILFVIVLLVVVAVNLVKNDNEVNTNWIVQINPIYYSKPSNAVYLYEDSYVISNSIITNDDYINHKGKLKTKLTEDLIKKIKKESENVEGFPMYKIVLNSGEQFVLYSNTGVIREIENIIDYNGVIWYANEN